MKKLSRLAKLRQFDGKQTVEDFLKGEFRQNMLAIEDALKFGFSREVFYAQINTLLVANGEFGNIGYINDFKIDPTQLATGETLTFKEDGSYSFDVNLTSVFVNGQSFVSLEVYVNGISKRSFIIADHASVYSNTLCFATCFPMLISKGDKVILKFYKTSGVNVTDATMGYGLLRISKLTI